MPDGLNRVQGCVDALAVDLCRPVVLLDRRGRVMAYSRHTGAIDRLRSEVILSRRFPVPAVPASERVLQRLDLRGEPAPVWVPADAGLGLLPRVVVAVPGDRGPLAYLSVLDADGSLRRELLDAARWRIDQLGGALRHAQAADGPAEERDAHAVRALLSGSDAQRVRAAEDLDDRRRFEPDCAVVAVVLSVAADGAAGERRAVLEQCLAAVNRTWPARRCLHLVRAGHGVLLVGLGADAPDPPHQVTCLAQRLIAGASQHLAAATADAPALVGIGGIQPGLDRASVSYAQARHAVTVARVAREYAPIASWDRLGIFRLLVDLPERDVDTFAPEALRRLGAADDGTLLATLESYLDNAGHVQATARALCLHRATLYYRLDRIRRVSDVDLTDGGQRLELHLWLKLVRLRGGQGAFDRTTRHHDAAPRTTEAG